MLVITDRKQVLLQQRPDSGIWGGLLSLPEIDGHRSASPVAAPDGASFEQAVASAVMPFGSVASCVRLQPFSHGFTHFKLHIAPYQVTLAYRPEMAAQSDHVWYPLDRLKDAPLPAPVKKLLLSLLQEEDLLSGL